MDLFELRAVIPKPILKWAGGKQAISNQIVCHFPNKFETFYEPFLGGASITLNVNPKKGVAGDKNEWVIETYKIIVNQYQAVAQHLDTMINTKEEYLKIRSIDPNDLDDVTKAAHLIYLNKTCFRGLFRVNKKGGFNVPYGNYDRKYYSLENLRAFSDSFKRIDLRKGDFECILDGITSNDFVYFDPPYYKLGGHSDFNRYTAGKFDEQDQMRLASLCRELDKKGVKWALSNSFTPYIQKLYEGFKFIEVIARREINLKSNNRTIKELLIKNY